MEYGSLEFRKIMKEKYLRWSIYVVCWGIIVVYFGSITFVKELIMEQIVNKKILEQISIFEFIHNSFGVFLFYSVSIHISSIEKIMARTRLIEQEKDKIINLYKEYVSNCLRIADKIILCINNGNSKKKIEKYKGGLLRNLEQLIRVVNRRIYERGYQIYELERIDSIILQQEVVEQIQKCKKIIKKIKSNGSQEQVINDIKKQLFSLQEIEF